MPIGAKVSRIRTEQIFRECWNLITPGCPAPGLAAAGLAHALAPIGLQVLMVGLIMAGLFTGKRTGRSACWEHVRIGSSIL